MDVIVIGAGLGGLAAAVGLHRAGHTVTVLERAPGPRETGAGIGIMPNGVLALDALGLGAPVRAWAERTPAPSGMRDRHGKPVLVTDQAALAAAVGAPLVVVPRPWLSRLLAEALPPGTIRWNRPIGARAGGTAGIHQTADGALVDGQRADAVVAADGVRSAIRAALFPDHPGVRGSGEQAARGIATGVDEPLVRGELLDHRTGERFGCLPMTDGTVYWYSTWRAPAPAEPAARHRWLVERRADWHPCAAALVAATPAADVHVVETVQLAHPLPTLAVGRIALLGDAAHAMTPDLGQGACQAFEDAVALVAVVTAAAPDVDVAAALARYSAVRGPRTAALQRQCRRTHRLLTLRGPAARLRDTTARLIPPALATRAMVAQLGSTPPSALH